MGMHHNGDGNFFIKTLVRDCNMSNVIFLDVDEVLNSKFWDNEHQVRTDAEVGLTTKDVEKAITILMGN
jgi:hypothetical protein